VFTFVVAHEQLLERAALVFGPVVAAVGAALMFEPVIAAVGAGLTVVAGVVGFLEWRAFAEHAIPGCFFILIEVDFFGVELWSSIERRLAVGALALLSLRPFIRHLHSAVVCLALGPCLAHPLPEGVVAFALMTLLDLDACRSRISASIHVEKDVMRSESDLTPVLVAFARMSLMKMSVGNLLGSLTLQIFICRRSSVQRWPSVARHSGYNWSIVQSMSVSSSQAFIVVSARSEASLGPLNPWMWPSRLLLCTTGPLYVFFFISEMRRATMGIQLDEVGVYQIVYGLAKGYVDSSLTAEVRRHRLALEATFDEWPVYHELHVCLWIYEG
jgi:hypothetical protein